MTTLIFDTETNGLLDEATVMHCLSTSQEGSEHVLDYNDDYDECNDGPVHVGLNWLARADELVAHNLLGFDLPVTKKLSPGWEPKEGCKLTDTLVLSRLCFPDLFERDMKRKYQGFPSKLFGRHSLEAWGQRLGVAKGDYAGGWEEFSQDMMDYCNQDVVVLKEVLKTMKRQGFSQESIDLEHDFAQVIHEMNMRGVRFDTDAATQLLEVLTVREAEVEELLRASFQGFEKIHISPVKKIRRVEQIPFNPGSRRHITRALMEQRGWVPDDEDYTPSGIPKLSEEILKRMDPKVVPEAPLILESLMLDKRLGQLSRGKNAWLKLVGDDGIIRPFVNHMGTITGRCTHSRPNVGQVPASRNPYGKECRELWRPREGYTLLGSDASSVEVRILAHYLSPYDRGELVRLVEEGESPHKRTMKLTGIEDYDKAKMALYATLYGIKPPGLAKQLGTSVVKARKIQKKLLDGYGISGLVEQLRETFSQKGFLNGFDGRRIPIRKISALLNTLIQAGASVLIKKWTVLSMQALRSSGIDAHLVLHVHDEMQLEVPHDSVTEAEEIVKAAMLQAGKELGIRCRTTADTATGPDWSHTH
jgi:DNA polymerase I-like protein with 3'-5' exonuclease and polymerase domains